MSTTQDLTLSPSLASRVSILLVDDQPANLLALRAALDGLGQNLVDANSGEEALRRVLEEDFALVLLDVQMPGMDGFETARLIRGREQSRHTPIIFLTAFESDRFTVEQAYLLGAVDHLVKPLMANILRAKVSGFVELFEKTQQVKRQAEQIQQMERREFDQKLAAENARLRDQRARKTAILDTALDCIITIDHTGKIVEFNPAAEQTFGYRRDDVLGREMAQLMIPPAQREQHSRGLAHYLATGEGPVLGRRIEMSALRADGSEFPIELAVTHIPLEGPPLFTAYLRDITERKRAEGRRNARLAVNEILASAASVAEAAPGILKAVCEGLNWEAGAFWELEEAASALHCIGFWHTPLAPVKDFEAATRQRTFPPGLGLPGRVWSSGQPAFIPDVTRDANFPRSAVASQVGLRSAAGFPVVLGAEFLGVIEFFTREIRAPDADLLETMSTIGGQIGQFMERRRAEEVRRASEQRFARFMQQLPGLAWIKDAEGRYVYANEAALKVFRRGEAELYGKTDNDVFPLPAAAQFAHNDQRALASGTGLQIVETLEHENGVVHHSIVSKFPIAGPDGATLVGGMAIDITDRVQAEQQIRLQASELREADRLKDEFLATLAHELRNPLAPIRNALHIMKQPAVDETALAEVQDMAERQVQHMGVLLDDLLDVSRISRGRIELRKQAVDVAAIAQATLATVRPLVEGRRHKLDVTISGEPLRVEGDPHRLQQIVTNLLNNAAKYTDAGGQLGLTVERSGGHVLLRVRDTGVGIAPGMLTRIFDLFVQAERRLERSQGGVGIGLTLVKKLVELHGGTVEAHSPGLGHGSEFVVRLPALSEAEQPSESQSGEDHAPAVKLARRRILVVDDNQDAAASLGMLLQLYGQDVQTAHDGPSAIEAVEAFQPVLVFLDIGMPGMNGYEVARRLRQRPADALLLVALTGWGHDEDRKRSHEAGFDRHLVKPVEPSVVRQLLAETSS